MKFAFDANGGHRVLFIFFLLGYYNRQRTICYYSQGFAEITYLVIGCTQRNEDAGKLLQLYTGVHGEHLGLQLLGNC